MTHIAEHQAKREKFIKLAERRTNKAIKAIELIGNLGKRSVYEYSASDAEKIITALDEAIEDAKAKLDGARPQPRSFKL